MSFASRLLDIINTHTDGNKAKFARSIDVKNTTLLSYLPPNDRLPNAETLASIRKVFDVDLNWLCTGEGSPDGPEPVVPPLEQDRLFKIIQATQTKTEMRGITLPSRALAAVITGIYRLHEGDDFPPEHLVDAALDMVFGAVED